LVLLSLVPQDYDGWTPLHAAAHWAQREACELLADAYVNMDIKNCVGQTPFDVADPDVLRLLEELKKKQNNMGKDRPDIKALISRPPTTPSIGKGGRRSVDPCNNGPPCLLSWVQARSSGDRQLLLTQRADPALTLPCSWGANPNPALLTGVPAAAVPVCPLGGAPGLATDRYCYSLVLALARQSVRLPSVGPAV
jgi:hypothetical protein